MPAVPAPAAATGPQQAPNSVRSWRFWKMPVLAGCGFLLLQVGLFLARFGLSALGPQSQHPRIWLANVLPGLGLFWLAGVLAALVVRRLLRGTEGLLRFGLIGLAVAITPIAVASSLLGGLLALPFVALAPAVSYLIFLGMTVLGHRLWLLSRSNAGS